MKTILNNFFIAILLLVAISTRAQHHKSLDFRIPASMEKTIADTLYLIETDYPTTGLVISIPFDESFEGAFILAESDTFFLTNDEHFQELKNYQFSNLITFKNLIDQFYFYPGNLRGNITFSFIDARMPEKNTPKKGVKKKRCRLFRTRND